MQVPSAVLRKLLCEYCQSPLSRGPVYLLDNNKSRCGRCSKPKIGARRMLPYEELAKLVTFPCQYEKYGCLETVTIEASQNHEQDCTFQPFKCPIAALGKCDWFGGCCKVLQHCREKHLTSVVENSCQLTHSTAVSCVYNYILSAFHVPFLLQINVCTISKQVYYSVRLFGDRGMATRYTFTIDKKNCGRKLSVQGNVAARDCLMLCPVAVSIAEFLKHIVCTVTVHSTEPETKIMEQIVCYKCKILTEKLYHNYEGWLCSTCVPAKSVCRNGSLVGCSYTDFPNSCLRHETYYCEYSTMCPICENRDIGESLLAHYTKYHDFITYRAGAEFNILHTTSLQWIILCTEFGHIVCQYMFDRFALHLRVVWPMPTKHMYLYECIVKMIHPETQRAVTQAVEVYKWDINCFNTVILPEDMHFTHNKKITLQIDFVPDKSCPYLKESFQRNSALPLVSNVPCSIKL